MRNTASSMIQGDAAASLPPSFRLLALAAGAALRLYFIHAFPQIQGDSLMYGDIAKNWLTHGVYGFSAGVGIPAGR